MNKTFKRLLSVLLALVMVVGSVSLSGATIVEAADETKTIYLDTTKVEGKDSWGDAYIYLFNSDTNSGVKQMSAVSGSPGVFSYEVDTSVYDTVIFKQNAGDNWSGQTDNQTIPSDKDLFTCTKFDTKTSGTWGTYGGTNTNPTGQYTVYFDASGNSAASWSTNQIYIYGFDSTGDSAVQAMNKIGTSLYSYTFSKQYENVIFLRNNTFSNKSDKSNQTTDQTVPWTFTNPTFKLNGTYENGTGKKNGDWSQGSGGTTTTVSTFNVNATLVDYYNDNRVGKDDSADYRYNNEGLATGSNNSPYWSLNGWVSNLTGYANNGITDKSNANAPVPLYFGDLLTQKQDLTWYWKGANVAFGPNRDTANNVSAQGIVGKSLVDGHLVTSYTADASTDGAQSKVPFFEYDTTAFPNQDNYMKFYEDLEFPFTATTSNGVTVYSFDSEQNTVYYDYTNEKIVRDDNLAVYDYSQQGENDPHGSQGNRGYFPFNNSNDKSKLNFGFGTKFTIPFTVDPSGKDKNGQDVKFEFTGDDDVWVYIDDALVLDMGGAHNKASGNINFATQTATVTTKGANAKQDNVLASGSGRSNNNGSTSEVSFANIDVLVNGTPTKLDKYMKKSGTVHTLTMYYMERGMWNSNMSISFSFIPMPSGLSLSKEVNVADVNAGLQEAVKAAGQFDFKIGTRLTATTDADKSYTAVSDVNYTRDHDGAYQETDTIESDGLVTALADDAYAKDFEDSNGDDAFDIGTYFEIIEQGAENYDTTWQVTDIKTGQSQKAESGKTATFRLGEPDEDNLFANVQYNVNFKNTPKLGTLELKKDWNGTAQDGTYEFTVKVDVSGGTNYSVYPLVFTSSDTTRTELVTSSEGKVSLKPGETIKFAGIPAGASYQIEETAPKEGDLWMIDSISGSATQDTDNLYVATGKIELKDSTDVTTKEVENDAVTFKNKTVVNSLEPNKIVIDYGKAVTVDVVADDKESGKVPGNVTATVVGFEAYDADKTGPSKTQGYGDSDKTYTSSANGDYSVTSGGKVKFQLKRFLSEVEKVYCVVEVKSDSETNYYLNELDIIPATTMYYETDFSDAIKYTDAKDVDVTAAIIKGRTNLSEESTWVVSGSTSSGYDDLQEEGTLGKAETSYGYDTSYNDDSTYSNGTTSYIDVKEGDDATGRYAQFTFTGTGFDIISTTGKKCGTIKAQIYQGTTVSGDPYKTVTVANIGASTLYQIPVLSCEGLTHNTYTVRILAYGAVTGSTVEALNRGGQFYFDAVRIYNPISISTDTKDADTTDAGIALNAYKKDKEAYEKHFELRDAILSLEKFDSISDSAEGVVYIDATETNPTGSSNVAKVEDYKNAGPNNETYLKPYAQSYRVDEATTVIGATAIGFALHVDQIPETIQIGAKSVLGQQVSLDVTLVNPQDDVADGFTINNLTHATAQNYSTKNRIDDELSKVFYGNAEDGYVTYVYISNLGRYTNSEEEPYDNSGDQILSITDIKATFAAESAMQTTSSPEVLSVFQDYLDQGEPILDEDVTVEALKVYKAEFTKQSIRYTQDATLEVTTSTDVTEIVVVDEYGNETAINPTYEEDNSGKLWTAKFKPGTIGTRTFTVYGVDEAGAKTNTETVTIVAKRR